MSYEPFINELKKFEFPLEAVNCLKRQGIERLRPVQFQALEKGLLTSNSFLISAPSGIGKTLIGEMAAIHTILKMQKKSLYLIPLKALANEKFHYFSRVYANLHIKWLMAVGDQEVKQNELRQADFLIMTYEKFDAYLRNQKENLWISAITTVIVDEIHILDEFDRGPRVENLIIRLYHLPRPPQIIGLSATIDNPQTIANWLNNLETKYREKNLQTLIEDARPIELEYQILNSSSKNSKILEICQKIINDNGQILIFTNSRRDSQSLVKYLCSQITKIKPFSEETLGLIEKSFPREK